MLHHHRQMSTQKTGVLLLNMGGPESLSKVNSFLTNLFSDGDLIPIPFQSITSRWIASRRTPSIIKQYSDIGGGSPILKWTQAQGNLLADQLSKESQISPYVAFRYADPLTRSSLLQMKADGIKRVVALSLYPQYSCSTTGSSLNEIHVQLKSLGLESEFEWSVIDRYPTHPLLVSTFASNIQKSLQSYSEAERDSVILLFSAHSLPMSVVNRGDTYPAEVAATVDAVMKSLNIPNSHRLIWQSQVGPSAWLGPKADQVIEGYASQGKKHLLFIPIAFVSDHVETLYEVDIEYKELAHKFGIDLRRVDSLNDSPGFISALIELVSSHLKDPKPSNQLGLRCPMCINSKCGPTKSFFLGESS